MELREQEAVVEAVLFTMGRSVEIRQLFSSAAQSISTRQQPETDNLFNDSKEYTRVASVSFLSVFFCATSPAALLSEEEFTSEEPALFLAERFLSRPSQ